MSSTSDSKEPNPVPSSLPRTSLIGQKGDPHPKSLTWQWVSWALLSALVLASCLPIEEDRASIPATAVEARQETAPVPPWRSENITQLGTSRGSTQERNGAYRMDEVAAQRAVDGDLESFWSSNRPPTQWFSITFDKEVLVDRMEMVVAQFPAGPTTLEVWFDDGSGILTLAHRIAEGHTEDGQLFQVEIDPPQRAREVLILTLESPSWVAWRELRVYGMPAPAPSSEDQFGLNLAQTALGFDLPVQVTHAGDGSGRIFVVEQKGRIRIVQDGAVRHEPFLDITDIVSCCQERGLLNIAFPPSFHADRQFYVSYTNTDGNLVISRFTTGNDPNSTDLASEETILVVDQPEEIHNGGTLAFGPNDGFLYISSGEGGLWNNYAGQLTNTLLGKILRIDVSGPEKPYRIPSTNPFSPADDARGEIWALGIRNSWGFAFDKSTGDLFLPDVGHSKREEINFQPALSSGGENYGWPALEGTICFEYRPCTERVAAFTRPVAEYQRSQGCAIVGGAVYRGSRIAGLQGTFLFSDFCTGHIWGLERPKVDTNGKWQRKLLVRGSVPISSIGEDENGNVYATGYQDGVLYLLQEE